LVNNGGHRLQLIQQWWLPIVNGWCQPFAAHAMATTQHISDTLIKIATFTHKIMTFYIKLCYFLRHE
jgi:hypothetical protein